MRCQSLSIRRTFHCANLRTGSLLVAQLRVTTLCLLYTEVWSETDGERAQNAKDGIPNYTVGDGTVIERAILDKDARIGCNVKIINSRKLQEDEAANYVIREGIVVIPKGAVVPNGTVI